MRCDAMRVLQHQAKAFGGVMDVLLARRLASHLQKDRMWDCHKYCLEEL